MKKKVLFILSTIVLFTLSACSGGQKTPSSEEVSSGDGSTTSESSSNPYTPQPPVTGGTHDVLDIDLGPAPTYSEESFMFHYWRPDGTYADWNMWIWEENHDGASFAFNGKDDWGVVAAYPMSAFEDLSANQLGFIVRQSVSGNDWAAKDLGGGDLYVLISNFPKDSNDVHHVYVVSGFSNIYIDKDFNMYSVIELAAFANKNSAIVRANMPISKYTFYKDGEVVEQNDKAGNTKRVNIPVKDFDYVAAYKATVTLANGDVLSTNISKALVLGDAEFDNAYYYDGNDLGAIYADGKTTFKVWSPLSTSIKLRLYDTGTPAYLAGGSDEYQEINMTKGEKGVFSYESANDLRGKYYTYVVTNSDYTNREVVDPYAKSAGVNGSRGYIVDFDSTNPDGWDSVSPLPYDRKELTVYETHVADVSSSSSWGGTAANAKKFAGMYESGTTYTEDGVTVKTGFDHIKELGVNAVQIIPFFDQANDEVDMTFNWGYNPLNYNVVEGGYSSNPYDGSVRVRELKELIKAYNKAGINIIMDVVYNHTAGALGSNFDVLMPGYYYRYNGSVALSNGSGCGNEIASEHLMVRKFIIDSVKFWTSEYKLGGFRFDLMGLHDLETMNQLTVEAKKINPNICIYGEPWTGGTSTLPESSSAKQINGNLYEGYGAFNDHFRDGLIRGGLSGVAETGWITTKNGVNGNDATRIMKGIVGITASSKAIEDPDKTVNYATCHDNYTLHDRCVKTGLYSDEKDGEKLEKMNVLANSIVFSSNGTSFMLAGEEMLRTKKFVDKDGKEQLSGNSYNLSYETNELDYSLKVKHPEMFASYQKMIALKQNVDGLHLDKEHISSMQVYTNDSKTCFYYTVNDTANSRQYKIMHTNGLGANDMEFDLSDYSLYYSTIFGESRALSANTVLDPYETLVVYKAL